MGNKELDIIITHYDEPWEIGKPFFDMLENQRCATLDNVEITLVQDGEEKGLMWNELFSNYSFHVNVITISHGGPAAARNAGMKNTNGNWILFCDFDDMFADVMSLKMVVDLFPVTDVDLFWGRTINEYKWNGHTIFPNKVDWAEYSNTTAKFYRRAFLEENSITYNSSVPYHYEYMFNALVLAYVLPFRIAGMTSDFRIYLKTFREDSYRNVVEHGTDIMTSKFRRDRALADIYNRRGLNYQYKKMIATIVFDEYYRIYNHELEETHQEESEEFISFYRKHRDIFLSNTQAELDVIKDEVESETMAMIQDFFNKHKVEYYFVHDETPFEEWIQRMDVLVSKHVANENRQHETTKAENKRKDMTPVIIPNNPMLLRKDQYEDVRQILPDNEEPEQADTAAESKPDHEMRVAVYCGTYNTYMSMATSAKSLLYHTKMDKIYFLIEDDVFPYELPDIVECINVKNQKFFNPDGPNFNNDWSYMCLMRAAFAKLIPYKKILSFDIDVVIQEDIGCLWDYDMSDYYIAGVIEPQRQKSSSDPIYINFGVVMMNLEKIRQDKMDDKIIDALNTQKFGCPEQDAFNKYCAWHILQLPNDYNATVSSHITGEAEKERIIHYAGIRYWRHFGTVKEYGLKDWKDIMKRQAELHA